MKSKTIFYGISLLIYGVLFLVSKDWAYFWDNIQQIGNEGNYFYENGFSSLVEPRRDGQLVGTGYHIPLLAYVTAFVWRVIGARVLWVSHAIAMVMAGVFVVSVWRIVSEFVKEKWRVAVGLLVIVEPAVVTQFSTASPDFVMLSLFAAAVATFIERRWLLCGVCAMLIGCCNMRGVMATGCLLVSMLFCMWREKDFSVRRALMLVVPSVVVYGGYYTVFFVENGWFFDGSQYGEHYQQPSSLGFVVKHIASLGMRLLEQGRFVIWVLALWVIWRRRESIVCDGRGMFVVGFVVLQLVMWVVFSFITQMPFNPRYFMMMFFALSVVVLAELSHWLSVRRMTAAMALLFVCEVTGHLWVYPEPVAKPWDCMLAHAPYYQLKDSLREYAEVHGIAGEDVAGGGMNIGARIEISDLSEGISFRGSDTTHYFVYSNISNAPDEEIAEVATYHEICSWSQGFVFIKLYEK